MIPASAEKIFQVDDHIGAVASGLLADARVLVNQARIRAQIHRITYEEAIDVWNLARLVGDRIQYSTLIAGLRPWGVSILLGGVDKSGPQLVELDPSGMLYGWYAYAIGRGSVLANKILKQKWKPSITDKDAVALAVDILQKTEKEKREAAIDLAIIKAGIKFKKLSEDEIKKMIK
jgi:proteasome alpha subunit